MLGNIRLRTLLAILLLVAVLPSVALLLLSHSDNQRAELQRARNEMQAVAQLAAANQEHLIEGVRQILGTITAGPSVRRNDLAELCDAFIRNVSEASPSYSSMGVLDLKGNLRCPEGKKTPVFNASDRAYFRDALDQQKFIIGGYVLGRASGKKELSFGMPIFDNAQQLSGVAYVGLDLEGADRRLKALNLPTTMRVVVSDANGILLASSQEPVQAIGQPIAQEQLRLAIVAAGTELPSAGQQDADDTELLHVVVPSGPAGQRHIYIAVSAARDAVLGPATGQLQNQLAVLLGGTLLGIALASILANWQIARPVAQLLGRMQSAGRGEQTQASRQGRTLEEFAALDAGIATMLERLLNQQQQMLKAQEITKVGFYEIDLNTRLCQVSPTVYDILGLDPASGPLTLDHYQSMIHRGDLERVAAYRTRLNQAHTPLRGKYRIVRADGEVRHLAIFGLSKLDAKGEVASYEGALQDVTEQERQRRLFAVQSQINEAIVRTESHQDLFAQACRIAVETGQFLRASVAGVDLESGAIHLIAQAGLEDGYQAAIFKGLNIHGSDAPLPLALRESRYVVSNDPATDPVLAPWHDFARTHGILALAVVPIVVNGRSVAAMVFTTEQPHYFQEDENQLLQSIGKNLSYALTAIARETSRQQAIASLRLQEAALNSSSDGIVICDALAHDLPMVYVNPAFERITGYTAADVLGRNCRLLHTNDTEQSGLSEIRAAIVQKRTGEAVLRNMRKDGTVFWNSLRVAPVLDAQGQVTHFVGIQTDVSERTRYEEELAHRANYDVLTGLPNRQLLEDRLGQAIALAQRVNGLIGVAFVDLDNFKTFNDSKGHAVGDQVLRTVAERLQSCLRPSDTVARLGGDEFVLVINGFADRAELNHAMARIQMAMAQPISLSGKDYFAAASIGLAIFPRDGEVVSELIQRADFAMYKAKADGRGVIRTYEPALDVRGQDRLELERALRQALVQQELFLHYQPKYHAVSGELCGMEALIRWNHPDLGLVPPLQFIDVAEQTGIIVPIGEWVLEEACRQAQAWREQGVTQAPVAVNVSGIQFRQSDLLGSIARVLERTGLHPSGLHLEITESVMMNDPEGFIRTLTALKTMGVGVALDDFGTGYSSLSYLKRFPIDYVKIDRAFVRDITTDPMDAAICGAIIAMAHNLGMQVIAEGVETPEQVDFLRAKECDQLQGFLFGRPMIASDFAMIYGQIG